MVVKIKNSKRILNTYTYMLKVTCISRLFKGVYNYTPISKLVQTYRDEGKSWKYISALIYEGDKQYIGSTVGGAGNEIKIYARKNPIIKSINQIMKDEQISEAKVYKKYAKCIFQTAMPQSSIRPRAMKEAQKLGSIEDLHSIEYVPKTGKNKGKVYEQFYKGAKFRLLTWLRDVSDEIDGILCKKEAQGTYWDFVSETNNLTKEGDVSFPNGKKPESLLHRIIYMSTDSGDIVLDSFAGSGTTAAVAHKMGRKWITVELGEHCHTHIIPRLRKVINAADKGGVSKSTNWKGGGGFRYYRLAPSMLEKDKWSNWVISKEFNAVMLAEAMCKHMGFSYAPDESHYWMHGYSSETDFIYVTTSVLIHKQLRVISEEVGTLRTLLICCKAFNANIDAFDNLTLKKIPQAVLSKCEWGKDDYSLNVAILELVKDF